MSTILPRSLCASQMSGVEFRAAADRQVYGRGDPIVLHLSVVNNTERDITIWRTSFFTNHRIVIKNARGMFPEMTENGRRASRLFDPGVERMGNFPVLLAPGKRDKTLDAVTLSDLFVLPEGTYYANIIYEDYQCTGFSGILCSNEIAFEVVGPSFNK